MRNNNRFIVLILIFSGIVLLGGAIGWLLYNQFYVQQSDELPDNSSSSVPYPEIKRVNLEIAKVAHERGEALFLDVRTAEAFDQGHIVNAVNVPETEIPDRFGELNPFDWIITYCT